MEKSTFSSPHLNIVAIVAGILVTLASMFALMSLAAALGIWSYQINDGAFQGSKLWTAASISWSLSVLFGSLMTVFSADIRNFKSGILSALTCWAGSYLLFGGLTQAIADSAFNISGTGLLWNGFLGDISALIIGISGGILGVHIERRNFKDKRTADSKSTIQHNPEESQTAFPPLSKGIL